MRDIIAVCRSSKKSRARVATVLDTYFWRIGDRTWRGKASKACLERVFSDLRAVASKTTAVSIHDAKRQHTHQPPLLFVGSRALFSETGIVPIATSARSDSHGGFFQRDLEILKACAVFHDVGKGFSPFQRMILGGLSKSSESDIVRHEVFSSAVLGAYLNNTDMLEAASKVVKEYINKAMNDCVPIPDLKQQGLVGGITRLVASHHRSPAIDNVSEPNLLQKTKDGRTRDPLGCKDVSWLGSPDMSEMGDLFARARSTLVSVPYSAFAAADLRLRVPFMLADRIGSHRRQIRTSPYVLLANTKPNEANISCPADDLRQHTQRVMDACAPALRSCQRWAWPSLSSGPIAANAPESGPYLWQSEVVRHFASAGKKKAGIFGVLMAGTGSGKTIAGLCALSAARPGTRITTCLGLRSLTEQTAAAYAKLSGVPGHSVCRLVGGASHVLARNDTVVRTVGEDGAVLFENESALFYDAEENQHKHLDGVLTPEEIRALRAPLLVATIDHIVGVAVSKTGKGFPLMSGMRLLTSDFILDEIDQYDVTEIPALVRLARACGACGGNLLVMSATIRPHLGDALHAAYAQGRKEHAQSVGANPDVICVAASDIEGAVMTGPGVTVIKEVKNRTIAGVEAAPVRRQVMVLETADDNDPDAKGMSSARSLFDARHQLRRKNIEEVEIFGERKQISVGLIRMTRIDHAAWVACHLDDSDEEWYTVRVLLHANFPQVVRNRIEAILASCLTGKDGRAALVQHLENEAREDIREGVRKSKKVEFLVVSSPVIETGNDLDFDWAIIDAPTQRCVVQTAGRVRRNRTGVITAPNVAVFMRPWHTFSGKNLARPGIEDLISLKEYGFRLPLGDRKKIQEVKFHFAGHLGLQNGTAITSALVGNNSFCDILEDRAVLEVGRMMDSYFREIHWQSFNLDYFACSGFRGGPESYTLLPVETSAKRVSNEWTFVSDGISDLSPRPISVNLLGFPDSGWLLSESEIHAILFDAKTHLRKCPAPMGVTPENSGKPLFYDGKTGVLRKNPQRKSPSA